MNPDDHSTSDGKTSTGSIDDFDDYYDLLGVSSDAPEESIKKTTRELLAKYHPDSSEHPESSRIFKEINRAETVLTNSEQRTIYDTLGHDQYVKKSEEGEVILSKGSQPDNGSSTGKSTGENEQSESTTQENDEEYLGSAIVYDVIENFSLDRSFEAWISLSYKRAWLTRVGGIIGAVVILEYYLPREPTTVTSIWNSIIPHMNIGVEEAGFLSLLSVGLLFTFVTGIFSWYRIPAGDVELDYSNSPEQDQKNGAISLGEIQSKDNPSQFDSAENPHKNMGMNIKGANGTEQTSNSQDESEKTDSPIDLKTEGLWICSNMSETIGASFLFISLLMTAVGGIFADSHPWRYLHTLALSPNSIPNLWWAFGGGDIQGIVSLYNVTFVIAIALFSTLGLLLFVHGFSKQGWWREYLTGSGGFSIMWDLMLIVPSSIFVWGSLYSQAQLSWVNPKSIHPLLSKIFVVNQGFTGVSAVIFSLVALLSILLLSSISSVLSPSRG